MKAKLMSYSYALLGVTEATYREILAKLEEAGYGHAINDAGEIDMHGIALIIELGSRRKPENESDAIAY